MGSQELLTRRKILLISVANELTYPEFHFKTETKVDGLASVQQYQGNHVLNGCLQYSRMRYIWALNSRGNNFNSK